MTNHCCRTKAPGGVSRRTVRMYWSAVLLVGMVLVALGGRAGAQLCIGDCDGDGRVTVNELITGVNVELGIAPLDACRSIDCNARYPGILVPIDCMVVAMNNAMDGCDPPTNCTVASHGGTTIITCRWTP